MNIYYVAGFCSFQAGLRIGPSERENILRKIIFSSALYDHRVRRPTPFPFPIPTSSGAGAGAERDLILVEVRVMVRSWASP